MENTISIPTPMTTDVIVYEYGVRLDRDCEPLVNDQIRMARSLYNDLVACIRQVFDEMHQFVLDRAGPEARQIETEIEALNTAFAEARAASDDAAMKVVAQQRREKWTAQAALLKEARTQNKTEIQRLFLSRIGKNSACPTYQIRSAAVKAGLGWATANEVLDSALQAYKKRMMRGQPPRFARGYEKTQDSLTLQFTLAGGLPAETLLSGGNAECALKPTNGCGRRKRGELVFRLGPASDKKYATGVWTYHRPIPPGSHVGMVSLVRKRIGKDNKYTIQLMVKLPGGMEAKHPQKKRLASVHMGWSKNDDGRYIAAIADQADPGSARLITLPDSIEADLARSAEIQAERDSARDAIVPFVKAIDPAKFSAELAENFAAVKRLPAQHIAPSRLHWLYRLMRDEGFTYSELDDWRLADRMSHQSSAHIARRARLRRLDFYRCLAADLARTYQCVVLEKIDLKTAAIKIDVETGERTEFGKKARAGRVVASLSEFHAAIKWACAKNGAVLLEMVAETVSRCGYCGSDSVVPNEDDFQLLSCSACGAEIVRKQNGAAVAWQLASEHVDDLRQEAIDLANAESIKRREAAQEKKSKLAAGRAASRAAKREPVADEEF